IDLEAGAFGKEANNRADFVIGRTYIEFAEPSYKIYAFGPNTYVFFSFAQSRFSDGFIFFSPTSGKADLAAVVDVVAPGRYHELRLTLLMWQPQYQQAAWL